MRQRVGLARALTVNAEIILMDEPFSSVDEQTRRKFQEDPLDLLRRNQKTVIFVTHSIEEAVYLGSRVIVMSSAPGRIVRDMQVDLGAERWAHDVRLENDFEDYVHDARRALQEGTAYERG